MIKITILYPNLPGHRFDMDYYLSKHMPLSIERLSVGKGFQGVTVERGITGGPDEQAPYLALCHYLFDTFQDFVTVFSANAEVLNADVPNYTDIEGIIQISEVIISR